ncbi:MAG: ArsR family transcriptional regulator, partial [Rothia mucilaginosa]
MTQSQHTDQIETNTTHTDHAHEHASDHTHEVPTNAPLLEGSGPK